MASAKQTPKVSRISRGRTLAYARKQKPPDAGDGARGDDAADAAADIPDAPSGAEAGTEAGAKAGAEAGTEASVVAGAAPGPAAQPTTAAPPPGPMAAAAPAAEPAAVTESPMPPTPAPEGAPSLEPASARIDTVPMPVLTSVGAPPEIPPPAAPVAARPEASVAEAPTRMPGPREIPDGHPDDPASPPGIVPRGDSRSMRRRTERHEFALIYRMQTFVISRAGEIGTRGQWRVVEYPTPSMAAHAYAKECSRFVSEGFSDYRE